jgi:hypothetical protein
VSVPTRLSDPASVARLRIVAHAAGRAALANDDKRPGCFRQGSATAK